MRGRRRGRANALPGSWRTEPDQSFIPLASVVVAARRRERPAVQPGLEEPGGRVLRRRGEVVVGRELLHQREAERSGQRRLTVALAAPIAPTQHPVVQLELHGPAYVCSVRRIAVVDRDRGPRGAVERVVLGEYVVAVERGRVAPGSEVVGLREGWQQRLVEPLDPRRRKRLVISRRPSITRNRRVRARARKTTYTRPSTGRPSSAGERIVTRPGTIGPAEAGAAASVATTSVRAALAITIASDRRRATRPCRSPR